MEDRAHLPAGEVCSEAEVFAESTECKVVVRIPRDIESIWVGKNLFVAVPQMPTKWMERAESMAVLTSA